MTTPRLRLAASRKQSRREWPRAKRAVSMDSGLAPRGASRNDDWRVGDAYVLSFPPAIRMSLAIWLVRVTNSSRSRRAAAGSLSSTRWNRLRLMRMTVECSSAVALDGRRIATHQRELAEQRAGTRGHLGAGAVIDAEGAALHHKSGIGILALLEQHDRRGARRAAPSRSPACAAIRDPADARSGRARAARHRRRSTSGDRDSLWLRHDLSENR